jgi:hypothetical protein
MTHSTDIPTLIRWMAGDFSNQAQAYENPPFFAHIRVCMRPLPPSLTGSPSLYLEQAYDLDLSQPYRVRILKFIEMADHITIENHEIIDSTPFHGASRDPNRLAALQPDQIRKLPGCTFLTHWTGHSFKASVEPGKGCIVFRKDKETYLDSEFEVTNGGLISLDRGRDPATGELIWGSIAGPFEFTQTASFAHEVL